MWRVCFSVPAVCCRRSLRPTLAQRWGPVVHATRITNFVLIATLVVVRGKRIVCIDFVRQLCSPAQSPRS